MNKARDQAIRGRESSVLSRRLIMGGGLGIALIVSAIVMERSSLGDPDIEHRHAPADTHALGETDRHVQELDHRHESSAGIDEDPVGGNEHGVEQGHHDGDSAEAGHDKHEGEHAENVVTLDRHDVERFGLGLAAAQGGVIAREIEVPGNLRLNQDRVAHIVARVPGVVREVRSRLGDHVKRGELLAVLDSREIAEARAAHVAACERLDLARTIHEREAKLWKKGISPELDYLEAKRDFGEARIALNSAKNSLAALGVSTSGVDQDEQSYETLSRYALHAPFAGTVIAKHISLGEYLDGQAEAFIIADLDSVWVDLNIYRQHLPHVRAGQRVRIAAEGAPDAQGTIDFVTPILGEETRSALAKVTLPNPDGSYRPGLYVTGAIDVDERHVRVKVPREALVRSAEGSGIFVFTRHGYELHEVEVGLRDAEGVEILSGLEPGDQYVSSGALMLHAELSKEAFGHGHAH